MNFPSTKIIYVALIGIFVLCLLTAAYFYLQSVPKVFDAWHYIPRNPVFILESDDIRGLYQEIQKNALWYNLRTISYFQNASEQFFYLSEMLAKEGSLGDFLKAKKLTASLHLTSKDNFDLLLYVPLQTQNDKSLIQNLLNKFKKNLSYKFFIRAYKNLTIQEVSHPNFEGRFSFLLYKNFFIGSYSPILIEDVVRKIDERGGAFVFKQQTQLYQLTAQNPEKLRIYINTVKLPEFLTTAVADKLDAYFKPLAYFADKLVLNLGPVEKNVSFRGFSQTNNKDSSAFLHIFQDQKAQPFTLKHFIPNNTALFFHLAFGDSPKFVQALKAYLQRENMRFDKNQRDLETSFAFKFDEFYYTIDKEIAFCILGAESGEESNKLLFIKNNSLASSIRFLNRLSNSINLKYKEKTYLEEYQGYTIRQIRLDEFPEKMLGSLVQGFSESYYFPIGQAIVFTNNIRSAKQLIDDFKSGNVWTQSAQQKQLLNQLNQSANLSVALNVRRLWGALFANASSSWQDWMTLYERQMIYFDWMTLQFNPKDTYFVTDLSLKFEENNAAITTESQKGYQVLSQTKLPNPVFTQPFAVINHNDNSQEILVQDFKSQLYLIAQNGALRWGRSAGAPLRSKPVQMDIYKNNRLQYLFITADRIHLIDRVGRNVPGFPIFSPDSTYLHSLTLLEFEKGKYNFLTSDIRGNLYMYDTKKNKIAGWRPKKLNYKLATTPQHFKVQDKDYIAVVQENGLIQIFLKDGQSAAGFPLRLEGTVSNPLWIETGFDASKTYFTCLTESGQVVRFNLLGEVLKNEQLYMPSAKAKFWLCSDKKNSDYLIALTDGNYAAFYTKNLEKLFEKNYQNPSLKMEVQYFKFENNVKIIALTNPIESKTYLYDLKGKEIGEAINSNKAIDLLYYPNEKKLKIYRTFGNSVGTLGLSY